MGGALEDRITAEHDYRVNQLALQHLIAWHRDAHAPDCPCVRRVGSAAEGLLTERPATCDPARLHGVVACPRTAAATGVWTRLRLCCAGRQWWACCGCTGRRMPV